MRRIAALFLGLVFVSMAFTAGSDRAARTSVWNGQSAQLGEVNFQTSCAPQVKPTMDRAVALLHSFQYQQAESAFSDASRQDPHCAMTYWGKAMSLYHQLWDFPDAKTLASGREDVSDAEKADAKTQTERDYIAAAAAFYQDKPGMSHEARVAAYAHAMAAVYKDSPRDANAAGFYALALVNLAGYESELANRKQAIAILQTMFKLHSNNPGLAHYLIHATDTPALAPLGLEAARRYAKIAPDSSHALHMPSHIFMRLGLWQESVDSNVAAAEAARKATLAHQADADYQLHAMDFLDYTYLQNGQEAKAREVVGELKDVPGASSDDILDHEAYFAARNAIELHGWREAAALVAPNLPIGRLQASYFARALGAARSGDTKLARAELAKLDEAVTAERAQSKRMGYAAGSGESADHQKVQAWIDFAEGKTEQALKSLQSLADREDARGVDSLAIPAREMLGDMLLEAKMPKEALEAYKTALKESPNRFDGLWGAAQAAKAAGDRTATSQYYSKLLAICGAGADRPEVRQAREYASAQ